MVPIPQLHYDDKSILFKYMADDSLIAMAQTCTENLELAQRIYRLRYNGKLKLFPETNFMVIRLFGEVCTRVSIKEYPKRYFDNAQLSEVLQELNEYCDHIKSVTLPVDNNSVICSQFFRLVVRQAERIKIYMSCRRQFNVNELLKTMRYCPALKQLHVVFCCGITCAPLFNMTAPNLQRLRMADDSFVFQRSNTYDALRDFIVRHPHVNHFELTAINTETMLNILSEFKSLEYMKLHLSLGTIVDSSLAAPLAALPALKDLYFECNLDDENIHRLFQIPQVTALRLDILWSNRWDLPRIISFLTLNQEYLQNMIEIALPKITTRGKRVVPTQRELKSLFPKLKIITWK